MKVYVRLLLAFAVAFSLPLPARAVQLGAHADGMQIASPRVDTFITRTYQDGSLLVIENVAPNNNTTRLSLETLWGGSIVELSVNGTNFVDHNDTGREIQIALWDSSPFGDPPGFGEWGWNSTQGGDEYGHGSPVLEQGLEPSSLYIKCQPLQWIPDNKGGGPDSPVTNDVFIEQWIFPVTGYSQGFRVHWRVTHFGYDLHTNAMQEFPAAYVNAFLNRFIYYGGDIPWKNRAVSVMNAPFFADGKELYTPEKWAAYVNDKDVGLTLYFPASYPWVQGADLSCCGTNYFRPVTYETLLHNTVIEGDVYVFAGDYKQARRVIYKLHESLAPSDLATPDGYIDLPEPDAYVSGVFGTAGWERDNGAVGRLEILIDGAIDGVANYGLPRPDVAEAIPHTPVNVGWNYDLDTTRYPNGAHFLQVRATDIAGNVSVSEKRYFTISNY